MHTHHRWIAWLLCPILLSACSKSVTYSTDRAPTANFQQYRTFLIADYYRFRNDKDPILHSDLNRERIIALISSQLYDKGLHRADEDALAELWVKFRIDIQTQQEFQQSFNNNWGWSRWGAWNPFFYPWGMPMVTTYQNQYEELTLVIDIIEAGSERLIWQGWGFARIDRKRRKLGQLQETLIRTLLSEYPYPPADKRSSRSR